LPQRRRTQAEKDAAMRAAQASVDAVGVSETDLLPAIRRPRQSGGPTKRQLALIAWTVSHPPPGITFGERAMIADKLTHWLTETEENAVAAFVKDEKAMLKALKRRAPKRWR
jgi:hypothetical protein